MTWWQNLTEEQRIQFRREGAENRRQERLAIKKLRDAKKLRRCRRCKSEFYPDPVIGRIMYCTPECKAEAKRERRYRREERKESDLHLPHLVDLSNQELQDLLPLRKIGEQCKFETDRVLRFMHDNSPVDLLMPDGWKATPWIYFVREKLIEAFAEEGLTLKPSSIPRAESSYAPKKGRARAKSRLYHPEDVRAKAVRLYTEGRTAREVVEVLRVPVPISTVHKWLHDAGASRSPAEAWRNRQQ